MKAGNFIAFFFASMLLLSPLAAAGDIILSVNQTDYYFPLNQTAEIPLQINNTYASQVGGMLSYTMEQQSTAAGATSSSTSTQSQTVTIQNANYTVSMVIGSSSQPLTVTMGLSLAYSFNGTQKTATLDQIKVHFVSSNESQQESQQQKQESQQQEQGKQSTTQEQAQQSQQNQQQSQQQNPQQSNQQSQNASQAQQNQMSQSQQNELSNRLGNNGITQDSSALKQQMESQMEEQEQAKAEMLETLNQDKEFQKLSSQLQSQGFEYNATRWEQPNQNKTTVKMDYKKGNETRTIAAQFSNAALQKVEIEKTEEQKEQDMRLLALFAFAIAVALAAYYIYKKYFKKIPQPHHMKMPIQTTETAFDYHAKALSMLENSRKEFDNGQRKPAFSLASSAVRLYLRYEHGVGKELTNYEAQKIILAKAGTAKELTHKLRQFFEICSLVEFAKLPAGKEEFDEIYQTGFWMIGKKKAEINKGQKGNNFSN